MSNFILKPIYINNVKKFLWTMITNTEKIMIVRKIKLKVSSQIFVNIYKLL